MKNFIKQTSILSVAITIAFVVYMGVQIVQGAGTWNPPGCDPTAVGGPGACNAPEPINVSTSAQKFLGSKTIDVNNITTDIFRINSMFRVDYLSYFADKVGIGTTNPSTGGEKDLKLDVEGAVGAKFYCDEKGDNCKTITEMVGGEGVLEKGTALYKTTSCTTQANCADPNRTRSLGTANFVTTESSTGYSSSCYNNDGDSVPISCTSSNTFIGYSAVYFSSVTSKTFYAGYDNNGDDDPDCWTSFNGLASSCYNTQGGICTLLMASDWEGLIRSDVNPNGKPGSTDIVTNINSENVGGSQACQGSLGGSAIDTTSDNWKITYILKEE